MYLKIKLIAGAKEERIEKLKEDEYRIWVKEEAKNFNANNRLLTILQELFPRKSVRLISGHTSPSKIISIN